MNKMSGTNPPSVAPHLPKVSGGSPHETNWLT